MFRGKLHAIPNRNSSPVSFRSRISLTQRARITQPSCIHMRLDELRCCGCRRSRRGVRSARRDYAVDEFMCSKQEHRRPPVVSIAAVYFLALKCMQSRNVMFRQVARSPVFPFLGSILALHFVPEQALDQVYGVRALETRMADVALRTADASELATYLSHVYRQPIPTDHVAMRNA